MKVLFEWAVLGGDIVLYGIKCLSKVRLPAPRDFTHLDVAERNVSGLEDGFEVVGMVSRGEHIAVLERPAKATLGQ